MKFLHPITEGSELSYSVTPSRPGSLERFRCVTPFFGISGLDVRDRETEIEVRQDEYTKVPLGLPFVSGPSVKKLRRSFLTKSYDFVTPYRLYRTMKVTGILF